MGKQKDDLPGRGHEMMSGREWFDRAAHSLTLVRYSRLIRFPVSPPSHIPRRFRKLISSCRLGSSCSIVVICSLGSLASSSSSVPAPYYHRPHSSRSSVSSGRGARRDEVIRIVSSARRGQASRMDGKRAGPRPCHPCRPGSHLMAGIAIRRDVVIRAVR